MLHHGDQLVAMVAMAPAELEEVLHPRQDGATLGRAGHGDGPSTAEFNEPLFSQETQCAEHGVGIHPEHCGEVLGLRDPFTRTGFSLGDRSSNIGGHLFMEGRAIRPVDW
jgi:hypothetical protein